MERERPPSKSKVGTMLSPQWTQRAARITCSRLALASACFSMPFARATWSSSRLCKRRVWSGPDTQRRGHDRKKEQNGEHEKTVKVQALPSLLTVLVDLVGIRSSSLHFSLLLSLYFNLTLCRQDISPLAAPSAEVQITKARCSQRRSV